MQWQLFLKGEDGKCVCCGGTGAGDSGKPWARPHDDEACKALKAAGLDVDGCLCPSCLDCKDAVRILEWGNGVIICIPYPFRPEVELSEDHPFGPGIWREVPGQRLFAKSDGIFEL